MHDIHTLLIDILIGNMEQHKVMACPKDIYLKISEGRNCYCVCIQGCQAWDIEILRTVFLGSQQQQTYSSGSTMEGWPITASTAAGTPFVLWRTTRGRDFDHGSIKTFDMPQRLPAWGRVKREAARLEYTMINSYFVNYIWLCFLCSLQIRMLWSNN
jgi:hypothetical protein